MLRSNVAATGARVVSAACSVSTSCTQTWWTRRAAHNNSTHAIKSLEAMAAVSDRCSELGGQVIQDHAIMGLRDLAEDYQYHVLGSIRATLRDPNTMVSLHELWHHFDMEAYAMDAVTRSNLHTRNRRPNTLLKRVEQAKTHPELYPIHHAFVAQLHKDAVTVHGWCLLVEAKQRRTGFAHGNVRAAEVGDIENWNKVIDGSEETLKQLKNIFAAVAADDVDTEA